MEIENLVLNGLIHNDEYMRVVTPHLRGVYFSDLPKKNVYELIVEFIEKYNERPTSTALEVEFLKTKEANNPEIANDILDIIGTFKNAADVDNTWLADNTEKWCKERAIYLAIMDSIGIINGNDEERAEGAIPGILSDALAVSFDTSVGHDYLEDAEARWEFYHKKEEKIPFDITLLNDITSGGVTRKTLNVLMGGCMRPDTRINIRQRRASSEWSYSEIEIGACESLLDSKWDVEVTSPDGWVEVDHFINKGDFEEYELSIPSLGKRLYSNLDHLYETDNGWVKAKDMLEGEFRVLCADGNYHTATCRNTGNVVPIVDIHVLHDNHRYYTDGVSSHNTGSGKSLGLCHLASHYLSAGHNVLYITCEMSEERIAERIDANLLDVNIKNIPDMDKDKYFSKLKNISKKTEGRLITKEYPTGSAHVGHFRALIQELKMKKQFTADVIIIDYLNICASSRFKGGSSDSYGYVKAIAEELRGLAVECNVPMWSATQTNRDGLGASDLDMKNTSESVGLVYTVDLFIGLIQSEEMKENDELLIKQLKNRYNDLSYKEKFMVGIDKSRMRWYDIDSPVANIMEKSEAPVNSTPFAAGKKKLQGIKV